MGADLRRQVNVTVPVGSMRAAIAAAQEGKAMVQYPPLAAPLRWGRLFGMLPAFRCLVGARQCVLEVAKVLLRQRC